MSQFREGREGLSTTRSINYDLPSRGLQLNVPSLFADKRFSPFVQNVRFFAGEITNRPGLIEQPSPFSADPAAASTLDDIPIGGHAHVRPDGTYNTLASTSSSIYYYDDVTENWDDATGIITFGGADTDPWAFATFDDDAYFSNGVDNVHRWRSATHDYGAGAGLIEEVTNAVPARYLLNFAGRLILGYVIDSGTQADRVQWSNINDPTTWAGGGFNDTVDWPGPITGLSKLGARAYIFKRDYIIEMRETGLDSPTFDFRAVVNGEGAGSHRTIVHIGQLLFFMGRDDVFIFDGTRLQPIGEPIRWELTNNLNREAVRNAFAFHHEPFNEYWLCVPTGDNTYGTVAFVFNYVQQAWTKHTLPATCSVPFKTTEGAADAWWDNQTGSWDSQIRTWDSGIAGADVFTQLIGKEDQILYKIDDESVTDDGTDVTATFDIADTDFGTATNWTTLNRVIVVGRSLGASGTMTVSFSPDGGSSFTPLGTATFGAPSGMVRLYIPCRVTAIQGRVRLSWTSAFVVQRVTLEVLDREESR